MNWFIYSYFIIAFIIYVGISVESNWWRGKCLTIKNLFVAEGIFEHDYWITVLIKSIFWPLTFLCVPIICCFCWLIYKLFKKPVGFLGNIITKFFNLKLYCIPRGDKIKEGCYENKI